MTKFRLMALFMTGAAVAALSTGSALAQEDPRMQLTDKFLGDDSIDDPDHETEVMNVEAGIAALTDAQVAAFNRALTNAMNNGLVLDLDAEDLDRVIAENFDDRDINFLTKAFEEEAKFESKAESFEDRAEATGDDKFLEKADRARAKGERQKQKFLARIDSNSGMGSLSREEKEAAKEARRAEKLAAKEARRAEKEVRRAVREAEKEARRAAKEAQKEARRAAKEAQKEARRLAKEEAKAARRAEKEARRAAQNS